MICRQVMALLTSSKYRRPSSRHKKRSYGARDLNNEDDVSTRAHIPASSGAFFSSTNQSNVALGNRERTGVVRTTSPLAPRLWIRMRTDTISPRLERLGV